MRSEELNRYSRIDKKNCREIVLLKGTGCKWRRCSFCDYHLDGSINKDENFEVNKQALDKVSGIYGRLETVNSGSFTDLDEKTVDYIRITAENKKIKTLYFEGHYSDRFKINEFKKHFNCCSITVKFKTGVETFDSLFRETYLLKGIDTDSPSEIAEYFNECCLLFGISGQTFESMKYDIETGLRFFERICINIMTENSTKIKPDKNVINVFTDYILPKYIHNERVDILLENNEFGVGAMKGNK